MKVAWQPVMNLLKRFSEFHVGIEPKLSVTSVRCSNYRARRTPGELGRLTGCLYTKYPASNAGLNNVTFIQRDQWKMEWR